MSYDPNNLVSVHNDDQINWQLITWTWLGLPGSSKNGMMRDNWYYFVGHIVKTRERVYTVNISESLRIVKKATGDRRQVQYVWCNDCKIMQANGDFFPKFIIRYPSEIFVRFFATLVTQLEESMNSVILGAPWSYIIFLTTRKFENYTLVNKNPKGE